MTSRMLLTFAAAAILGAGSAGAQDIAAGQDLYDGSCKNCHGPTAKGMASFPKLADKSAEHLTMRLEQYRAGEMVGPNSALMQPMAADLSDADIMNIAAYITDRFGPKPAKTEDATDAAADAGGTNGGHDGMTAKDGQGNMTEGKSGAANGHDDAATKAHSGDEPAAAEADVASHSDHADMPQDAVHDAASSPAMADANVDAGKEIYQGNCKNCHGPTAKGMASFPKLSDKSAEHLTMRLEQYRAGEMVGPNSALMHPIAGDLSDADIADIAAYITETFQ
ncbi:c-type cytochrome [Profundibacterium mesophilum]|uniref:Cytochrome n=1 Tax=Profundibacterium mesophilum KAUST100406-0324 TaxID=1037889 RepID=A0A921NNS8_9RHOB|nr:c-type cytochrome [Profundibacterium mesophilum]KAF0675246.1 Cytochrome [Profundibacterium mesophilum KAUST100406-0324]